MSDKANDTPFEVAPTFRSVPLDVEISLDPSDQRLRFEETVGAYYPNPDGEFYFVTIADVDRDGIYGADGNPNGQPGWLLRAIANTGAVITNDQLPLGALSPNTADSPRLSAVAAIINQYQSQLGVTQSAVAYGVLARVENTFTIVRTGTADPEPDQPVDVPVDPPVVTPAPVPHLRHATRHVQATVLNVVREQLTALGWTADETLPFGPKFATKVRFTDAPAIAGDKLVDGIGPGTIACTVGPEFMSLEQEIGGPLTRQDYPIFFDVFQSSYAATTALANDIRDILMGRFPGSRRHLPVIDQTDSTPVGGWVAELSDIEIARPEIRMPLHWQVVKVTAEVYFPEVQY